MTKESKMAQLEGKLFVRNATGLVRDVSPVSQTIFNILPAAPGIVLAISLFWILAVFPGGSIFLALALVVPIAAVFALTFGLLSQAMPRSGGDYVLVSRSLHPALGLASSLALSVSSMFAMAFVATATVSLGLVPSLSVIGIVSHNQSWINDATTISSQHWTLAIALLMVLLSAAMNAVGVRRLMRIQNILFATAMLGFFVSLVVMLFTSTGDFISAFNSYADPLSKHHDTYHHLLATAKSQGISLSPAFSFSQTIPAIGAVSTVMIYSWWSVHVAGEARRATTWRQPATMVASLFIAAALVALGAILVFSMAGTSFVTALNGLYGTPAYPFASAPYFFFLAAIGAKSSFLAVFLAITFMAWFPLWAFIQLIQPMRALFAWSFDGILPQRVSQVDERTHVPLYALGICTVVAAFVTWWAVTASNFAEVLSAAAIVGFPAIFLVGVSAIVLPLRRPEVLRGTLGAKHVVGAPLLTWLGALTVIGIVFLGYVLVHYPGLGIQPHPVRALVVTFGVPLVGIAIYFIAAAVNRSRGVDLNLSSQELPAE
jgi:APA family basic amino acid/polyamine antiporter